MMLAHGLSVALLFMLSTCVYHRSQSFDMSAMGGLAQRAPVLAAFFVAATMASIGLPGFGNFWGSLLFLRHSLSQKQHAGLLHWQQLASLFLRYMV